MFGAGCVSWGIKSAIMKKYIFAAAALMLALLPSCRKEDTTGRELTILCENLKPFSYREGGQLKGITSDVVTRIMTELELTQPIFMSSNWDSLLNQLKTGPNVMLFTTGLTPERKGQFRWVGPVTTWNTAFVGIRNSGIRIATEDDAKKLTSVGVVTGYSTVDILTGLGFSNLMEFNTFDAMVKGLFDGSVEAIFDFPGFILMNAIDQGLDSGKLTTLLVQATSAAYLAFSKDVSDKVIETWQTRLDQLKDNGFLQGLFDIYLPGTRAPGRILMFTEENPPQSFRDADGTLKGSSVDMVRSMIAGTSFAGPIEYASWTNCYAQIELVPNSMAFSTLRTPERENLFHWVGPVCKKKYCFYVHSANSYDISTIDMARSMRSVGTVTGWGSEQELINLGFANLVTFSTPQEVFSRLMDGDIPCAVLNDISMAFLAQQLGHQPKDYRKGAVLSEGQTYLAFSLDTDDDYIKAWEDAYTKLVNTGELARIWKGWYPDVDW